MDKKQKHPRQDRRKRKIPSDVQGSYTGTPQNDSQPVQDADDL